MSSKPFTTRLLTNQSPVFSRYLPNDKETMTVRGIPGSNAAGAPPMTSGFRNADPMYRLSVRFFTAMKPANTNAARDHDRIAQLRLQIENHERRHAHTNSRRSAKYLAECSTPALRRNDAKKKNTPSSPSPPQYHKRARQADDIVVTVVSPLPGLRRVRRENHGRVDHVVLIMFFESVSAPFPNRPDID